MKFSLIWNVIKDIVVMSHGLPKGERGFSVNSQVMTDIPQISEKNIIAQRLINDYIYRVGGVTNIIITSGLLPTHCTQARENYMTFRKGRGGS